MFTLEIEGRAVAVIGADEASARDLFTCDGFKDDIRTMTSGGSPLWDGKAKLVVRAATPDEIDEFEEALSEDDGSGDFADDPRHQAADDDEDDEADIVFLIDLDDEDEDEEDDDKDDEA